MAIWTNSKDLTFVPTRSHHQTSLTCKMTFPSFKNSTQKEITLSVQYPPSIIITTPEIQNHTSTDRITNQEVTVQEGSSLALKCSVDSNPGAQVTWMKGEKSVLVKGNGNEVMLYLRKIPASGADKYHCLAENNLGAMNQTINIIVQYVNDKPVISDPGILTEGKKVTITCNERRGYPNALITWENHTGIWTNSKDLTFVPTRSHHQTSLTCKMTFPSFKNYTQNEITLSVQYPPSIIITTPEIQNHTSTDRITNQEVTVQEGSSLALKCLVDSNPGAQVTWMKGEKSVLVKGNGNEVMLYLRKIPASGADKYHCLAENNLGGMNQTINIIVQYVNEKPVISDPGILTEGKKVTITCNEQRGYPNALITWENQTGIWTNSKDLTFVPTRSHHQTSLTCKMTFPSFKNYTQNEITLSVQYPPSIIITTPEIQNHTSTDRITNQEVTVQEGSSLALKCLVDSNPVAQVTWMKGEKNVLVKGNGNEVMLYLSKIPASGADKYHCLAENNLGAMNQTINIIVQYVNEKPVISDPGILTEGKKVTITCNERRGSPNALITWENQTAIWTNSTDLTFVPTRSHHQTSLTCKMTFPSFKNYTQNEITLSVQYPPSIIITTPEIQNHTSTDRITNQEVTVQEGSSLALKCSVDSNPGAQVTWMKGEKNVLVKGNGNEVMLYLSKIPASGADKYHCLAENNLGAMNQTINIIVQYVNEKPVISDPGILTEGKKVTITCNERRGYANTLITWENHTGIWTNSKDLTFVPTRSHHQTSLTCKMTFPSFKNYTQNEITLSVQYPPSIIITTPEIQNHTSTDRITNQEVTVQEGSSMVLKCSVDSNPGAQLTWMKGEKNVLVKGNGNEVMLYLSKIPASGADKYHCLAENNLGAMNQTINIIVQYPPSIIITTPELQNPTSTNHTTNIEVTVQEGSSLALRCSVDSNPRAQVTWMKGGENILSKGNGSELMLYLNDVTASKADKYHCLAHNNLGAINQTINIIVQYPPSTFFTTQDSEPSNSNMIAWLTATIVIILLSIGLGIFGFVRNRKKRQSVHINSEHKWSMKMMETTCKVDEGLDNVYANMSM
ncbi:hemicentin-1-like [Rana temporaria]|uniref:hemicentin-1-like n=1 Tax=Rana temporaria TaxID=8407 RepID=UPI001AAC83BB|nr:hemicentin-1-like [Rana temporaria]